MGKNDPHIEIWRPGYSIRKKKFSFHKSTWRWLSTMNWFLKKSTAILSRAETSLQPLIYVCAVAARVFPDPTEFFLHDIEEALSSLPLKVRWRPLRGSVSTYQFKFELNWTEIEIFQENWIAISSELKQCLKNCLYFGQKVRFFPKFLARFRTIEGFVHQNWGDNTPFLIRAVRHQIDANSRHPQNKKGNK